MSLEKRIESLEGVCKQQRQPIPSFVVVDGNGEPINEYYAEVLRLNREVEARGEDVTVFRCISPIPRPVFGVKPTGLETKDADQAGDKR